MDSICPLTSHNSSCSGEDTDDLLLSDDESPNPPEQNNDSQQVHQDKNIVEARLESWKRQHGEVPAYVNRKTGVYKYGTRKCSICKEFKDKSAFSQKEADKPSKKRKCNKCMGVHIVTGSAGANVPAKGDSCTSAVGTASPPEKQNGSTHDNDDDRKPPPLVMGKSFRVMRATYPAGDYEQRYYTEQSVIGDYPIEQQANAAAWKEMIQTDQFDGWGVERFAGRPPPYYSEEGRLCQNIEDEAIGIYVVDIAEENERKEQKMNNEANKKLEATKAADKSAYKEVQSRSDPERGGPYWSDILLWRVKEDVTLKNDGKCKPNLHCMTCPRVVEERQQRLHLKP